MLTIKQILTFAYDSEYESAYDLSEKRPFSQPKIYTGNGDLNKRWYVYFSFRDPGTCRLKRQTPIYGNANGYKTKEERLAVLTVLQKTLLRLLRKGFNPYKDNTELFNSLYNGTSEAPKAEGSKEDDGTGQPKEPNPIERQLPKQAETEAENGATLDEAFSLDAEIKSETLQPSSQRSYNSHINVFRKWLAENRPKMEYIGQLDKQTVLDFLKHILKNSSARNRNNYRASLSSLFSTLEEHEYVSSNFVKRIKVYKSNPKRNKSYTDTQQQEIFDHLEKEDPLLLLFIKFVSYNFFEADRGLSSKSGRYRS
ncbi:phage integrase N-terminal SAM-like domain-containing protein [Tamlana crocina]